MKFLEKNLEDIMHDCFLNQEIANQFIDKGFDIFDCDIHSEGHLPHVPYKSYRQLHIGGYGRADIVNLYRCISPDNNNRLIPHIKIEIVELKKGLITIDSVHQIYRYLRGVKRYMKTRSFDFYIEYSLVIIGSGIDNKGDWLFILDQLTEDSLYLYKYDYCFNGISFEYIDKSFKLREEGF